MKNNVANMPMNTLYKFDNNQYVIALMLNQTRNNSFPLKEPKKVTEVYQIDPDGVMTRIASGELINNPNAYDFDKMFAIKDYDMDTIISFKVNEPFEEVKLNELYKVRDSVNKSKMERNR